MSVWQRWLFVKTLPRVLRLKTLVLPKDTTRSATALGSEQLLQDQNPEEVSFWSDRCGQWFIVPDYLSQKRFEEKGHKEPSPFCSPRLRLLSLVEVMEVCVYLCMYVCLCLCVYIHMLVSVCIPACICMCLCFRVPKISNFAQRSAIAIMLM